MVKEINCWPLLLITFLKHGKKNSFLLSDGSVKAGCLIIAHRCSVNAETVKVVMRSTLRALSVCVRVYVCDKYSSESPCACVLEPQRSSCQYPWCIYLYLLFGSKSLQCRIIVCFIHILRHEKLIIYLLFNHCAQRPNYQNVACCMCIIKALVSNRFGPVFFFYLPVEHRQGGGEHRLLFT